MNLRGLSLFALGLVLAAGGVILVIRSQPADPPQRFADPATWASLTLPEDLPDLGLVPEDRAPAAAAWQAVLDHHQAHASRSGRRAATPRTEADPDHDRATAALLEAARAAGPMPAGFLDRFLPESLENTRADGTFLSDVPRAVLRHAERQHAQGDPAAALRAARSAFALGHQAFTTQVRLQNRALGLSLMQTVGTRMHALLPEAGVSAPNATTQPLTRDALVPWARALGTLQQGWQPKMQLVGSPSPAVGDLLALARHDQDPTFRLAATYALALARFNPGHRGNLREILATARAAQADADPALAAAGRYVLTLTRDDLHRLR